MGLMIGLVFGEPTTPALRRRFRMVEALRPALFSQMIVVPLFHRHRILTQVAADNMNVVKLLPPLIAGDDEVELFTDALDDVLASAEKGSSLIFEFGKTMAKGIAAPSTGCEARIGRSRPRHRGDGVHRLRRHPQPRRARRRRS